MVDDVDPKGPGVHRITNDHGLAFNLHASSGFGLENPGHDFHERAFPGPIFTSHRMDFAATNAEVHAIQGSDTRKRLRNCMHL
jgi:hypothetical protein